MTRLRQSSASSFAARLVEPTRSQNITVIGRRSATIRGRLSAAGFGGKQLRWQAALRIQRGDRLEQPLPIAESGDADVLEVGVRQPRQYVRVDLVVAKCGLVLAESEAS